MLYSPHGSAAPRHIVPLAANSPPPAPHSFSPVSPSLLGAAHPSPGSSPASTKHLVCCCFSSAPVSLAASRWPALTLSVGCRTIVFIATILIGIALPVLAHTDIAPVLAAALLLFAPHRRRRRGNEHPAVSVERAERPGR